MKWLSADLFSWRPGKRVIEEIACAKCGDIWMQRGWWMRFGNLEGKPALCERCLYEGLTGQRLGWAEKAKE